MTKTSLAIALLASTALVAPFSRAAAQSAAPASAKTSDAPVTTRPSTSRATLEEIVVMGRRNATVGGGMITAVTAPKAVSVVNSAFIATQPSIQNVYQYVALTPGTMVSTTDPYGLSEQFSINVHGLGQDELGYVLEGMPLNDIGYYTAYPSQFVDSENVDEVSLAPGTADLDSPVISATGGLMTITMIDPSVKPGGLFDASYGSYDTYRAFLRLDSGDIANTGIRAFASYSYTHSNDWHGPGAVVREHSDFKFVKEWNNGSRVSLSGEIHSGVTPTYIEPTLGAFQANGVNNNYEATFTPGDPAYYRLNIGTFRIVYLSAPSKFVITPNITLSMTPYWQYGYGNSPYGTLLTEQGNYTGTAGPYTIDIPNCAASGGANYATNGCPVMADFTDLQYREGVVAKTTYATGPNTFLLGFWLDHSDETDTQPYTPVSAEGIPSDLWVNSDNGLLRLPDGNLFLAGADKVGTTVFEPFIGDTLHLFDDKLTIEAGLKEAWVWRHGINYLPGPQYGISIDNVETLPRLAVRYTLDDHNQLFFNVSTNFRTPSEQTMFAAYYGGYEYGVANANLKTEYSVSEDVGYRYNGPIGVATISFFNFKFWNRQISTVVGGSLVNESVNAGAQSTYGVDVEYGGRSWHHISPYVSGEYLHSVDDNDLPYGDTVLPTAGKTSIRSPEFQGAIGLSYDDGNFFGNFNVKAVSSQFSTFMNDEKIPGYATVNLGFGARLPSVGLRGRPTVKVNFTNLTGINYLSSVANPTANAQPQLARDGVTVSSGASPTYYLSGGRSAMVTVSQAF